MFGIFGKKTASKAENERKTTLAQLKEDVSMKIPAMTALPKIGVRRHIYTIWLYEEMLLKGKVTAENVLVEYETISKNEGILSDIALTADNVEWVLKKYNGAEKKFEDVGLKFAKDYFANKAQTLSMPVSEDINLQIGDYVLRKHIYSGDEGICYSIAEEARAGYGYGGKSTGVFNIVAEFATWIINSVPTAKAEKYGIFLIEDTKEHAMILLEHHTGNDHGMGYIQYIPGHYFRGIFFPKT